MRTEIAGRYRVLRQLGRGALGAVYEARPLDGGPSVALKVLDAGVGREASEAERFLRGARAGASLEHPHIVRMLDAGRDADGTCYLAQELLSGIDLERHLRALGRLDAHETLAILGPIMDALAHVHSIGVVHRDIKPANVFLARVGDAVVPKLLDFGFAKSGDATIPSITQEGMVLGSPLYMAPEYLRGAPATPLTDQWSLAVTLYECLAGTRPFSGRSIPELVLRTYREDAPALHVRAPELSAEVCSVVHRSLHKVPSQRWADVAAMRAALSLAVERSAASSG